MIIVYLLIYIIDVKLITELIYFLHANIFTNIFSTLVNFILLGVLPKVTTWGNSFNIPGTGAFGLHI